MNLTKQNGNFTEGVSPVIGVILMVVITVVLGAIVATYMLDFGDQANQQNANAAVTFDQSGSAGSYEVTVQALSMPNADSLTVSPTEQSISAVGETATISSLSAGDKVTVTATLNGNKQVIQSYTVQG